MKNVLAMILAGGRGKRMGHLCDIKAKPVLSVGSNLRVIDFCLSNCVQSGIKSIALVTGYQGAQLARYVTSWAAANTTSSRIHILDPKSAPYSGTADAVWKNINMIKRNGFEWIMILPADHVSKMNFRKLIQFHKNNAADITIAVARVPQEHAHRYGIVTSGKEGRILEFREKPNQPSGNLASMGIYVFNRQALLECLADDASKPYSPHDFGYSIMPEIVKRKRVFAYMFNGYWQDIGTVESYYQTNIELIDQLPKLYSGKNRCILSQSGPSSPCMESNGYNIVRSLVSPGCQIRGRIENSVLSPRVTVSEHAVVTNSIIMSGSSIGEHSHLDNCLIDEDVSIDDFCLVGLQGNSNNSNHDITVVGPHVRIPSHSVIQAGSRLLSTADLPLPGIRQAVLACK